MPKISSKNTVVVGSIVFILVIVALVVGLFLVKQNQDIRQQAYNGDQSVTCVKAGCSNQLCVPQSQSDIATTCEWKDEYACYQQATCELQENGKCGFTPSSALQTCLANIPQSSASPTVSGSCENNSDCQVGQICYHQPIPECVNGVCPAVLQVMPYCMTAPNSCSKDQTGRVTCPSFSPPSPSFCPGGSIVSGGYDQCGCQKPPTCQEPDNCLRDPQGNVMCPQWDPAPGFCVGGTIVPSPNNNCGCSMPPTCKYNNPITIGQNRPTDQQLYYERVSVNQDPSSRMITTSDVPVKDEGNAKGYIFKAAQGQKLHILAKETDLYKYGSYIRTSLYDINGKVIKTGDTRISDFIVPQAGDYYLVVYTFKKVDAYFRLAIFEQNKLDIKVSLVNDQTLEQTIPTYRGKAPQLSYAFPFSIVITFPNDAHINQDGTIGWFDKLEGIDQKTRPILFLSTDLYSIKQTYDSFSTSSGLDSPQLSQAGANRVIIKDHDNKLWPTNYHYLLKLHAIYDNQSSGNSVSLVTGFFGQYAWSATVEKNIGYCDDGNSPCMEGYQCITPPELCEIEKQQACAFIPHCEKIGQRPSADLNNDGRVDIDDYSILKQELMKQLSVYRADINNDGWVDLDDYTILKSQLSLF